MDSGDTSQKMFDSSGQDDGFWLEDAVVSGWSVYLRSCIVGGEMDSGETSQKKCDRSGAASKLFVMHYIEAEC